MNESDKGFFKDSEEILENLPKLGSIDLSAHDGIFGELSICGTWDAHGRYRDFKGHLLVNGDDFTFYVDALRIYGNKQQRRNFTLAYTKNDDSLIFTTGDVVRFSGAGQYPRIKIDIVSEQRKISIIFESADPDGAHNCGWTGAIIGAF